MYEYVDEAQSLNVQSGPVNVRSRGQASWRRPFGDEVGEGCTLTAIAGRRGDAGGMGAPLGAPQLFQRQRALSAAVRQLLKHKTNQKSIPTQDSTFDLNRF